MKKSSFPIVVWKTRASPLVRERLYACVNYSALKSPMGAILWKSGSWKTFTLAGLVFSTFANSLIERKNSKLIIVDPHNSVIPRILGLIGEFYSSNPINTRTSSVLTYAHPSGGGFGYVPKNGIVRKPFHFNPLVPFSDGQGGFIPTELQIEWLLSSLQSVFAVSDFGPRNLLATGTVARMMLAFNKKILETKTEEPFFTMKDLAEFFLHLSNTGTLPPYVEGGLSKVDTKTSGNLRPSLRKMVHNVKTDKSYFDSSNTKFGMFLLEAVKSVFGCWIGPKDAGKLYDPAAAFLKPRTETSADLFDLSGFGDEKSFIAACVVNAAYFFGKKKPNPAPSEHLLVVDEFQSLIGLRSDTLYFTVRKILFECRKFGVWIFPVFQELTENVKALFSNFGFVLVFALRQDAATKMIDDLNAWIVGGMRILPEHVSNLWQGQFFWRFDTKKNGVLAILARSIDFSKPEEVKALLGLSIQLTD